MRLAHVTASFQELVVVRFRHPFMCAWRKLGLPARTAHGPVARRCPALRRRRPTAAPARASALKAPDWRTALRCRAAASTLRSALAAAVAMALAGHQAEKIGATRCLIL